MKPCAFRTERQIRSIIQVKDTFSGDHRIEFFCVMLMAAIVQPGAPIAHGDACLMRYEMPCGASQFEPAEMIQKMLTNFIGGVGVSPFQMRRQGL